MINIAGYKPDEKIYQGSQSVIYRGRRLKDDKPVVLKILRKEFPTPEEIARFKREFEVTSGIDAKGVIKAYSLDRSRDNLIMVLEDFGGESLARLKEAANLKLTLIEFLELAIRTADILGEIHRQNIIHKDINPSNILRNPGTGVVKIIDFGIAAVLPRETVAHAAPDTLEGTLAYMSPEQTGRMNRAIDYHTDFYSLGATFYELLTSQLPFHTTDPMELVHGHIARMPAEPHRCRADIPKPVSDIVVKLMAKNAEDRYQGAYGLKHDLRECLDRLTASGKIDAFEIGKADYSEKFQVPQKLYGREKEIQRLLKGFERVCGGTAEMMLVAGYSGIGKTSLVREVHKPIVQKRGHFISGKFDQLKRNIPYTSLIQAFQELVRQLLTGTEEQVRTWKDRILRAVGINGQVIIDVIPDVELVTGKQPPVPELPPAESQNRFHHVFQNFIRVFARKEHPLTIFLDDLQWIDPPSLKLVEMFVSDPETRYLFFIGAYRDNEVDPLHPLMLSIKGLEERGCRIVFITLPPLGAAEVNRLTADALHCTAGASKPLSDLCLKKTGGNPFFLNQFLQTLYHHHLLEFDGQRGGWRWQMEKIEKAGFTDNVVNFLVEKLRRLPGHTQNVLKTAAAIGVRFSLGILSPAAGKSYKETADPLWEALREQLIFPTDEKYTYARISDQADVEALTGQAGYQFSHDRIHQAAYSLIGAGQKAEIHLKIGRLLLEHLSPQEQDERLFDIVNHLDEGMGVITRPAEIAELAKLNLLAARKAKSAIAYQSALEYAKSGMRLLKEDNWRDHYETVRDLHKERALLEYLNGHIEESRHFIDRLLTHAKTTLEKAEIYNLLIVLYTMSGSYSDAIRAGKDALTILGMDVPAEELRRAAEKEIAKIKEHLENKDIASLIRVPGMTDPGKKIAMNILMNMGAPSYYIDQQLFAFVAAKKVRLSLEYGHVPASCAGYSTYGLLCGAMMGDYQTGFAFGQLALKLNETFDDPGQKCKSCVLLANYLGPWVRHLKESESINEEGYQAGLNGGEMEYAGYSLGHLLTNHFFQGKNLEYISTKNNDNLGFFHKTGNRIQIQCSTGLQLVIMNLRGKTADRYSFDTEITTEKQHIESCKQYRTFAALCDFYIFKARALYIYRQPAKALEYILKAKELLPYIINRFASAEHNFYYSLILAALYPSAAADIQEQYREQLENNQKQMKTWADNCRENFHHKYLLVEAELARIEGQDLEAMDLYDQAVESAREHGFIQDEALANERCAGFWSVKGKAHIAGLYMARAYQGFQDWGSARKVRDLEETYPQLLPGIPPASGQSAKIAGGPDVFSLLKATQALSAEIVLPDLLKKIMHLIEENAGAQKSLLILKRENGLFIELEGSIPLEEVSTLHQPASLIRYVARTKENLVLNNACCEGDFTGDAYILGSKPLSVLCTPILHQGKLTGIIYLENNLTPGAFTADRLQMLNILSTQAAISIENARLYETLEEKVAERTGQLRSECDRAEMYFDLAGVIMVTLDSRQRVQRINKKGCEILGYPQTEIIGKNWFDTFVPEPDRERTRAGFRLLMAGEVKLAEYFENQVAARTGEGRLVAWHNTLLRDGDGKIIGTLSSGEDITQRRRAEDQLKAAFHEKEILLKEIHHRVKNNLQIASSLLSLQSFKIEDEQLIEVLNDSVKRINSMAEIHKLLYETESFANIPFDRYLKEISTNFFNSHSTKTSGITLKPDAENIFIDIAKAVPCALIINELLSNAFKYAFPGGRPGEVEVVLHEKDDRYTLIVGDNGVGFPGDLDIKTGKSLGMTIVKNLVAQLRGDLHLDRKKGAVFTITFPKS